MRIGFIFECGPAGADQQVCEYLARQLRPEVTPISRTLDNKPRLIQECGAVAAALLKEGCERVLIVWDLHPAWPNERKPCRKVEREAIVSSLGRAGVVNAPVFLVCIEQELESWLLADERKISAYLSTAAHSYPAPPVRKPDRVPNPKSVMMKHFQTARGRRYVDRTDAIRILQTAEMNLSRLRRSPTFVRFESKLRVPLP